MGKQTTSDKINKLFKESIDTTDWTLSQFVKLTMEVASEAEDYMKLGGTTLQHIVQQGAWEEGQAFLNASMNLHEKLLREHLKNLASQMPDISELVNYKNQVARDSGMSSGAWVLSCPTRDLVIWAWRSRKAPYVAIEKLIHKECLEEGIKEYKEWLWTTITSHDLCVLTGLRIALGYEHEGDISDQMIRSKSTRESIQAAMEFFANRNRTREAEDGVNYSDSRDTEIYLRRSPSSGFFSIADPYFTKKKIWVGPRILKLFSLNGQMTPLEKSARAVTWDMMTEIPYRTVWHKRAVVRPSSFHKNGKPKDWENIEILHVVDNQVTKITITKEDIEENRFVLRNHPDLNRGEFGEHARDAIIRSDFMATPRFRFTRKGKLMATFYIRPNWGTIDRSIWPHKNDAVAIHEYHDRWTDGPDFPSTEYLGFRNWALEVSVYGNKSFFLDLMDRYEISYTSLRQAWERDQLAWEVTKVYNMYKNDADLYVEQHGFAQVMAEIKAHGRMIGSIELDSPEDLDKLIQDSDDDEYNYQMEVAS